MYPQGFSDAQLLFGYSGFTTTKDWFEFTGIDMINKFITEINITSPTGLMHLQQKDKDIFEKIAHQFSSVITHYHDE